MTWRWSSAAWCGPGRAPAMRSCAATSRVDGKLAARPATTVHARRRHRARRSGQRLCLARQPEDDRGARPLRLFGQGAWSRSTSALRPAASPQVLLERGAAKVFAIDVGHGQLDPELAADPRVVCAKASTRATSRPTTSASRPGAIVADVSFISLRLVLPPVLALAGARCLGHLPGQAAVRGRPRGARQGRHRARSRRSPSARPPTSPAWLETRHGLARRRHHPVADRGRRRQPRVPAGRPPWLRRSTIAELGHAGDGIAETAEGQRSSCPSPCRARPSPSSATRHTRAGSSRSSRRAPTRVRAALPPLRRLRRLRAAAHGRCRLSRLEAGDRAAARSAAPASTQTSSRWSPRAPGTRRRAVFSAVHTTRGLILGFHRRGRARDRRRSRNARSSPGDIVAALPSSARSRQSRGAQAQAGADHGSHRRQRPRHRHRRRRAGGSQRSWMRSAASPREQPIARLTVDGTDAFANRPPGDRRRVAPLCCRRRAASSRPRPRPKRRWPKRSLAHVGDASAGRRSLLPASARSLSGSHGTRR